jgi:hypothetical protein
MANVTNFEIKLYSSGSVYAQFLGKRAFRREGAGRYTADFPFFSNLELLEKVKKRLEHLFASYTFPAKVFIDKDPDLSDYRPIEGMNNISILGAHHFKTVNGAKILNIVPNQNSGLTDFVNAVCDNRAPTGIVTRHYHVGNPNTCVATFISKKNGDISDAELESAIFSIIGQCFGFNLTNIQQSAKSPSIGGNLSLNDSGEPIAATKSFEKNASINSKYFIHEQSNIDRLLKHLIRYSSEKTNESFLLTPLGGKKRAPYDLSSNGTPVGESPNFASWKTAIMDEHAHSASTLKLGLIQRSGDDDILLIPIRKTKEGGFSIASPIIDEIFAGFFTLEVIHPSQLSVVEAGSQREKYQSIEPDFFIHATKDETHVPASWKIDTDQKYNFSKIDGYWLSNNLNHSNLIAIRIKATGYKDADGNANPNVYTQGQNIGAYALRIYGAQKLRETMDAYNGSHGIYLQSRVTTGALLANPSLIENEIYTTMNGERIKYIAMHNKKIQSLDTYVSPRPDTKSRNVEGIIAILEEDGKFKLHVAQLFKYSETENLIEAPYSEQGNVFFSARKEAFETMVYKVD